MNKFLRIKIYIFFVFVSGLFISCQKREIFFTKFELQAKLQNNDWKRVYYTDVSKQTINSYWKFTKDNKIEIYVEDKATGVRKKRAEASYKIKTKILKGILEITDMSPNGDQSFVGKFEFLKINKKMLRIAKKGGREDNNPTTIEGGLILLEFLPEN